MKLENLSPEEQKKLKEYITSLKEIKNEIKELLEKAGAHNVEGISEEGGNMSSNLHLKI